MTKKIIALLTSIILVLTQVSVFAGSGDPIISNPVEEEIVRSEAVFVRNGSHADSSASDGLDNWYIQVAADSGARRYAFVKFDLTSYSSAFLSDSVVSLKFGLTPKSAVEGNFKVSLLSDANEQYVDTSLTYNIANEKSMFTGNTLLYTSGDSLTATAQYTGDIKSNIKTHLQNHTSNKNVVFMIDTDYSSGYEIYNKASGHAYAPHLIIESGINITNRLSEIKSDITWDKIKGTNVSMDSVTSNLSLMDKSLYDTPVTWSANIPNIDTLNGTVTRPAMYEGDAVGILTAEFGIEADGTTYSDSVSFDITVPKSDALPPEFLDPEICLADNAGFVRISEANGTGQIVVDSGQGANRIGFASFDLTEHIGKIEQAESIEFRITTHNGKSIDANWAVCVLPESMENMHIGSFTYAEAKAAGMFDYTTGAYISARGLEDSKAYYSNDIKSAVIASMQNDAKLLVKVYSTEGVGYTLWGTDGSDGVKPALKINYPKPTYEQDKLLLSIPSIVNNDIVLPKVGTNGSDISWWSSDETVISTSGDVTVGVYDDEAPLVDDKIVTLRATVSDGITAVTRDFDVRVKRTGVVDTLYDTYISETENNDGLSVIPLGGTNSDVALVAFKLTTDEQNYITSNDSRSIILKLYSQSSYAAGKNIRVTAVDSKPGFDNLSALSYSDASDLKLATNTYEYKGAFENGCAYVDVSEYVRELNDGYAFFILNSEDTGFEIDTLESKLGREPKLLISSTGLTDEYALSKAAEAVTFEDISADTDTVQEVRKNLTLPSAGRYGSNISWSALPDGIVNTSNGNIERQSVDTTVTLTATFEKSGKTTTKDYVFTVVKAETDLEFATYLLNKLSVQKILTGGIILPGAEFASEGATVTWASSKPSATPIADTYKLSVNRSLDEDIKCTLTATLVYRGETLTKDFDITLLRAGERNILKNKTISSGEASAVSAIDDNIDTYWDISNGEIIIDLNNSKTAVSFTIVPYENNIANVKVAMSRDGLSYENIGSLSALKADEINYINLVEPGSFGMYIKFNFSDGKISELAAYATTTSASTNDDVFANLTTVPASVTGDFTLPADVDGHTITWTSLTNGVTISGTSVSVTIGTAKYNATVKASVTVDGVEHTKNYIIYVDKTSGSGGGGGNGGGSGGGLGGGGSIVDSVGNDDPITPPVPTSSFNDLSTVTWATEYIEYLYDKGIVNGKGNGKFAPNDNLVREEFAKIIALGFEIDINETSKNGFSDVASGEWYEDYVNAIANAGITQGLGDGSFGVGREISRQDVMVMVARILNISPSDDYVPDFSDSENIADYAYESICALAEIGIISGDELGNVNPTGSITRAEMSKIVFLALQR